jgi:hypothetical protein
MFLLVVALGASTSDYRSVKEKFSVLEKGAVKPGSHVTITPKELNAYVKQDITEVAPDGFRNPEVWLGNGQASGKALIDFLKIQRATGSAEPNWILRKLLVGEREVTVTTRIDSSGGMATVNVEQVEISGVPISGAALDYLIQNYLIPRYPEAKIGQPFEIGYSIDRLEIRPNGVRVIIAR